MAQCGPEARGVAAGDLAVALVRHPCGDPSCEPCAAERQDYCASECYGERGILRLHGFMTEFVVEEARYVRAVPRALRDVAVLLEPLTIAEKAFAGYRAIASRYPWRKERRTAVVLGSGPVGLLGAMLLRHEGWDTWVYSRAVREEIVESIGARPVPAESVSPERLRAMAGEIDLVYEAMGAPQLAFDVLRHLVANGVFLLTGAPSRGEQIQFPAHSAWLDLMAKNQTVAGTVNAGAPDFDAAIRDLAAFACQWPAALRALITGRYPLDGFRDAIFGGGIKNVIVLG